MKALILTGGKGERLKPSTISINKCALDVNGKTLINYSLEKCRVLFDERYIEGVVVATGYREEDIIDAINPRYYVPLKFVKQAPLLVF